MKFEYESTINDFAEPHIRLHMRSKSYQKTKWLMTLGVIIGVFAVLLTLKYYFHAKINPLLPPILGVAIAIAYFANYPAMVSQNIKKYIKKELNDQLPCITSYLIDETKIVTNSLNITTAFEIMDLQKIVEDDKCIELSFGPKGICVIPKRVFGSDREIR